MHDVCTEQHVGNAKCASLSPFLSNRLLRVPFSLSLPRHIAAERPSVFFVPGVQSETSTIKPTILNEQAGAGTPRGRRDAGNCCEPAKCRIGGELVLAMAWRMHARDSTHSATGRRGRRRVTTPEYGSYAVC